MYTGMDFETRDLYRKAVEEIANYGQVDELVVARSAVSLAQADVDQLSPQPAPASQEPPETDGHTDLEDQPDGWDDSARSLTRISDIISWDKAARRWNRCRLHSERLAAIEAPDTQPPCSTLLGVDCKPLAGIDGIPLAFAAVVWAPVAGPLLVFVLTLIPALTIAVDLVNWAVTQVVKPQGLPSMDFSGGLPEQCTTLVVILALLSGPDEVDSLVGQLEQHYLRNPAPGLFFALLTDYMDAPAKNQPNDVDLVERARRGIRSLNEKYLMTGSGRLSERRFALLHRERRWNPSENVWMGWERKRGKLHELNCVILAARGVSLGGCSLIPVPHSPSGRGTYLSFRSCAISSPWMRTQSCLATLPRN